MTQTEIKVLEMGLEVAKMKGEYDAQLREITYLRSALEAKQNFIKPDVSGMLPLADVEKFIWEIGEDFHMWDEETQGAYPAQRTLTAIQKWFTEIQARGNFR